MSFLDEFVGHMQNVVDDTITHGQNVGSDITEGILGKGSVKEMEKKGILDFGMDKSGDIQGKMMGMGIGNLAEAFGVDPKTIMIVGAAAVVGIVVLLVVLKT